MLKNFRAEIEQLLEKFPKGLWNDVAGVWVDYSPWKRTILSCYSIDEREPQRFFELEALPWHEFR